MAVCSLLFSVTASAKPISYTGGWSVMQMNDADTHALHAYYAPSSTLSLGYTGEYALEKDFQLHALGLNHRLHRWNNPDSQGNLYLQWGGGVAIRHGESAHGRTEPGGYAGILADWEDRRYFLGYENRLLEAGDIDRGFRQQVRLGIAPYVADYGSLHTWLMLQVEHQSDSESPVRLTPLVRLFQGTTMVEAGIRSDGTALLNFNFTF
jgi:hypothetical protein